ncbi:MAG: hypothetical protein ACRD10_11845, partial [Terriglobia bacterium]
MQKTVASWQAFTALCLFAASACAAPSGAQAPVVFSGRRAFEDIRHLVDFGPRPPGSEPLAASRRWIIRQLQSDGAQVETDPFVASTPAG